jgi:predicted ArsR family transcriptional regulator
VTALAETAGLRLNTTRYHLDALVAEGLATRVSEPRIGPGRPKILYGPASPDPEMTAESYRSLADALLQQLSVLPGGAGDAAEAAGFAWGKSLAARRAERDGLARVVGTLGELGHELAVAGDPPRQIELRPCPFGEQLDADGDTVCRLHFGLIRGLAADDPEHRMAQLCPWVTPTSCLVALAQRPTAGAGAGEPTADSA